MYKKRDGGNVVRVLAVQDPGSVLFCMKIAHACYTWETRHMACVSPHCGHWHMRVQRALNRWPYRAIAVLNRCNHILMRSIRNGRLKSLCQNLRVDALTVSYPRLPLASSRRRIKTGMTAF